MQARQKRNAATVLQGTIRGKSARRSSIDMLVEEEIASKEAEAKAEAAEQQSAGFIRMIEKAAAETEMQRAKADMAEKARRQEEVTVAEEAARKIALDDAERQRVEVDNLSFLSLTVIVTLNPNPYWR